MIEVEIHRNSDFTICGFCLTGHAGFSESGDDIICSAVSILVINTINAIEKFTDEKYDMKADEEEGGYIDYSLPLMKEGKKNHDAELLLETMLFGLKNIENEYSCYIKINDKGGRLL